MPIGNGEGYKLKVETNIGGEIFHDEEVIQAYYKRNVQDGEKRVVGTNRYDANVFGHSRQGEPEPTVERKQVKPFTTPKPKARKPQESPAKSTEVEIDKELQKAMNNDLANRGLGQIKKPRSRKQPKTTTDNK